MDFPALASALLSPARAAWRERLPSRTEASTTSIISGAALRGGGTIAQCATLRQAAAGTATDSKAIGLMASCTP